MNHSAVDLPQQACSRPAEGIQPSSWTRNLKASGLKPTTPSIENAVFIPDDPIDSDRLSSCNHDPAP